MDKVIEKTKKQSKQQCFTFYLLFFSLLQDIIFIHANRDGVCPLFGTHNILSYPDKFADREIWEQLVECQNKENDCTWTDRLRHVEVKIQLSTYYLVNCVTIDLQSKSFEIRF